ncbi:MAG: DinB family protein, partial [Bacteroidota bacterium]
MTASDTLDLLATEHAAVAALLDDLSPEARAWRPAEDAWSAADVLEHLVKTERGMAMVLATQIAAGDDRRDVGTPSPEAFALLSGFLRSDRKTRVPAAATRFVAPTGEPYDALRAEWDTLLGLWREAFQSLPPDLHEVGLVKHPRAGALTARGAAHFAADHAHHHARQ